MYKNVVRIRGNQVLIKSPGFARLGDSSLVVVEGTSVELKSREI